MTHILWSSDMPYILKTIWCMNIILWDYESVWPDIWPQNKVIVIHILWSSDFALYLEVCLMCDHRYLGLLSQYDPMFDLKINVGHCDLYFLVQWFCIISWKLFDVWTSYFGIMGQYDQTIDFKIKVRLLTYISWSVMWVSYFQIMRQCHPNFDLKINIGQHDLYFLVSWFCLIFSRLFDGWTS